MAGLNRATIIGNVGRDPEVRSTQAGQRIANFTVATSEQWRDKASGEKKERTEWHRITVFNDKLVEIVEQYVRKGDKIYVEGSIETRKWTDNGGTERYTTEIVLRPFNGGITLLGSRSNGSGGGTGRLAEREPGDDRPAAAAPRRNPNDDLDDEIPF